MSRLPKELPLQYRHVSQFVSAYNTCLRAEKDLKRAEKSGEDVTKKLIYIRILGFLLHYSPSHQGLKMIEVDISSCAGEEARLFQLGKHYFDHYIRAFRASKGPIPTPSNHPSRPSFDTVADMINDTLVEAPQTHADAKKNALVRDNFCCCVTGAYDAKSLMENKELQQKSFDEQSVLVRPTHCAHIFSESSNANIEPGGAKRDYASSMWAIMTRFGYDRLPDELNGSNVHRLENVITLELAFHSYFDNLYVWFVETNEANKYKLESRLPSLIRDYPEYVKFSSTNENLPLPSPTYLRIHAACAKVAHLSGAAEHMDELYRDLEDSKVLSQNGSSSETLEHALFQKLGSISTVRG